MYTQTQRFLFAFFILLGTIRGFANGLTLPTIETPTWLIIYYDSEMEEIIEDSCGYFNSLLDAYHLEIVNTFEINKDNRGLTLKVRETEIDIYDLAKEISVIQGINMVEISNAMTREGAL